MKIKFHINQKHISSMKKSILVFLALAILSTSACKKDNNGDSGGSSFSAKLDGAAYEADGLWAYATDFSDRYTIYGLEDDGKGATMYLSIPLNATEGTYPLKSEYPAYYVDANGNTFSTVWSDGLGSVTITEIDADHVEGTFEFTAYDAVNAALAVVVTAGEFDVEFR